MKILNLLDHFNEEYEADIRNRKHKIADGQFSKHSFKLSELKRIYHICEKKERLRAEQKQRESDIELIKASKPKLDKNGFAVDLEFGKKNRNKGKKGKKKDSNLEDQN